MAISLTSTQVVVFAWSVAALFTVGTSVFAIWRGSRDGDDKALRWRWIKIWGSALGILGLITAMLTFQSTMSDFNKESEKYMLRRFVDLKFRTLQAAAIACAGDQSSQDARNECADFRNIDNQLTLGALYSSNKQRFTKIENWQNNSHLEPLLKEVNDTIEQVNRAMDTAYEEPLVSSEFKIKLGFFALFLIALALACSVGDAVYQLQKDRRAQRARPSVVTPLQS